MFETLIACMSYMGKCIPIRVFVGCCDLLTLGDLLYHFSFKIWAFEVLVAKQQPKMLLQVHVLHKYWAMYTSVSVCLSPFSLPPLSSVPPLVWSVEVYISLQKIEC